MNGEEFHIDVDELEQHAARLRNHIARIRIDFPEAAEARRQELHRVYRKIAEVRREQAGGRHA